MKSVSQSTADECINSARARGWKVEGQLEQGENGTLHYQLMVRTPQTRFSAMKKMFPTAHIEIARNADALREYVTKDDTRIGSLPTQNDKYPSVTKMWELIWDHITIKDWFTGTDADIRQYAADLPVGEKQRLQLLDEQAAWMIKSGYYIEQHIVNPQVRSSFAKFAPELCIRTLRKLVKESADRQTDRQVEIASQELNIPTTNADDSSGITEEDDEEDDEEERSSETEEDTEGEDDSDSGQESDTSDSASDSV